MKKTLLFLAIAALMTAGCSRTWSGIKQDTNEVILDTKEVIHEATAPDTASTSQSLAPLPTVTTPVEETEVITPVTK